MRHGSNIDPPNRFEVIRMEVDGDALDDDEELRRQQLTRPVEYLSDQTQSVIGENNSPDVPFRYSLNPYRGCVHGCAYCYARPTHEYLGLNAGFDFETKIVVKEQAPELFKAFLSKKNWVPEVIAFSGVTDCYQPAERQFRLTQQCLEVAVQFKQPIGIITKNALVVRDLDLLKSLAESNLVHVFVSITTLDAALARDMEPRTSTPDARLRTIAQLTEAGIPTGVMIAPVIPGLNDSEMPLIMKRSAEAGAVTAGYVFLRLPQTVAPVFEEWIRRVRPNKADMVLDRIRQSREGKLNNAEFKARMVGSGVIADQIRQMFHMFRKQYGLDKKLIPLDCSLFNVPQSSPRQLRLF